MREAAATYFDSDPKMSEHFGRIVGTRHHKRLLGMLEEEHGGEYIIGGPTEVLAVSELTVSGTLSLLLL